MLGILEKHLGETTTNIDVQISFCVKSPNYSYVDHLALRNRTGMGKFAAGVHGKHLVLIHFLLKDTLLLSFYTGNIQRIKYTLSHDIASGSDITPCNTIDKPLVFYRSSNVTL